MRKRRGGKLLLKSQNVSLLLMSIVLSTSYTIQLEKLLIRNCFPFVVYGVVRADSLLVFLLPSSCVFVS